MQDPFIQKGMKYKHVLAELVEECTQHSFFFYLLFKRFAPHIN